MKTIDARGLKCPMPLINTKKALVESKPGESLIIIIDNDTSVKNVTRYLEDNGIPVNTTKKGSSWELLVNKGDKELAKSNPEAYCGEHGTNTGNYVVLYAKNRLGEGDNDLGQKLLGMMLESLKAQDVIPDKLIFMNSGVLLITSGSPFLPALVELEMNGVELIACGTCLEFYGKKDELAIGRISNMFEIVEVLRTAGHVINV
jgi:selenium metabolism protein YedF